MPWLTIAGGLLLSRTVLQFGPSEPFARLKLSLTNCCIPPPDTPGVTSKVAPCVPFRVAEIVSDMVEVTAVGETLKGPVSQPPATNMVAGTVAIEVLLLLSATVA